MLNKVILMGRIVNKLELKSTNSGKEVVSFNIAVDRNTKDKQTDFIPVVAWGNNATFICNYFGKGKLIAIEGNIQTRTYTAQDGSKRYVTEVIADRVHFTGEKTNSAHGGSIAPTTYSRHTDEPDIIENDLDEELPF